MAPFIALMGFMGCGKTSVGRELARCLAWEFKDLDEVVTNAAGQEIATIFVKEGEAGFRAREVASLREIIQKSQESNIGVKEQCLHNQFALPQDGLDKKMVIALGGGTPTQPLAASLLKKNSIVVYLEIDAETAWRRVSGSDRPLARDPKQFASLLESRRPIYENIADITIPVRSMSTEEVVNRIMGLIENKSY